MNELILKCTKISITGCKNGKELKFDTIKIHGAGLNMLKFTELVNKINANINNVINLDDMLDVIINKHENIKIIIPNDKEVRMAISDRNGILALGVTFLSIKKSEFINIADIKIKYGL